MVTQLPANVNLSTLLALAPGTALTGVEPFETVQSGTSVAVTGTQLFQFVQTSFTSAALSVLGVAGAVAASVASIAGVANQALRVNAGGTGLAFGAINLATTAAVTGTLPLGNGGLGLSSLTSGALLYAQNATTVGQRQSVGFSIIGNPTTGVASPIDIQAVAADQVLVVNAGATSIVWGAVNLASASAVTGRLAFANITSLAGLSVLGVTGTATGTMAALTGTTDQVLRIAQGGTTLAFGAINLATTAAVTGLLANINGGIGKNLAQALPSGGSTTLGLVLSTASNFGIFVGTGVPSLAAATASLYFRNDGSTNTTRLYINSSGSTTWVAVTA